MKYLELYYKWAANDFEMPYTGLCTNFPKDKFLSLMKPLRPDRIYWASGFADSMMWKFTPLRQNIVLFMAAMNGEL